MNAGINKENISELKESQKKWVSFRNKCSSKECLVNAYRKRNEELCNTQNAILGKSNCFKEGDQINIYFAAETPPTDNIPPEAPLCYKFSTPSIEHQLDKLKKKYTNLFDYVIESNANGSKNLLAKRIDESGNIINYFYSTDPEICNHYQNTKSNTSEVPKAKLTSEIVFESSSQPSLFSHIQSSDFGSARQRDAQSTQFNNQLRNFGSPSSESNLQQTSTELSKIEEVITTGYGKDVPSAAQNAAQNALTQAVGSFMDSTKVLEKRSEIQNGIRTASSAIKTDIKEYSQGSIQNFDILKVNEEKGLISVTAKVSIRVEDFNAYIKKIAQGETEVSGESLFAQSATESKQKRNKVSILHENVISPIVTGEVLEFTVQKPLPLAKYNGYISSKIQELATNFGRENVFFVTVSTSLNANFIQNMRRNLDAIAQKKNYYSNNFVPQIATMTELFGIKFDWQRLDSINDVYLLINDGNAIIDKPLSPEEKMALIPNRSHSTQSNFPSQSAKSDIYLIRDAKHELLKKSSWSKTIYEYDGVPIKGLQIKLVDNSDNILQEEIIFPNQSHENRNSKALAEIADSTRIDNHDIGPGFNSNPWTLFSGPGYSPQFQTLLIFQKRTFNIFLAINQEALAKTKKIQVTLAE